ncbi:magnesium transporter [Haloechinothrix sp. LS1_15]|uniref:magnesium transporter n=1 Tax=Haloechinothrix sp. LS1_15 TaxID=2652248 RepID=UPI0029452E49|nr:magnesium transporter [Haloechinothrix sp. LS1_15]MDV6014547.1 magnesium transporter [Haloechinothrix sp. LS1_15]
MPTIVDLADQHDLDALRNQLSDIGALDIAEELARMPPDLMAVPFRLLSKERALQVFEALEPTHQQQLLEGLREERVRELMTAMDPDDRARLLDEVPAKVAARLIEGLPAEERQATSLLLGYPPESAGRIMSPEYVSLRASMTVADAMSKVRRVGEHAETVYTLPVTDDLRTLQGVISLRTLVTAAPDRRVGDLMTTEVHYVTVDTDQEEAARLIQDANILALPVVDSEQRLVGVITVDDAMSVMERETTEDLSRVGGVVPLEQPYRTASVITLARKRAGWLLLLGVAAVLTVNILGAFEEALEAVVALALFLPLLIDTGGNSGAQASTVVIRALSVDEVRFRDLPWLIRREIGVGALLGLILGVLAFPLVTIFFGAEFGLVIGLSLFAIVIWATLAGAALPLLAQRLGLDPAVLSAPIITTLVDATGLLIYLGIAVTILTDQIDAAAIMINMLPLGGCHAGTPPG